MEEVRPGGYYRHFKGALYQVMAIARDSETKEKMVVYQALDGSEETWVRSYAMFTEELDKERYPEAGQRYRFERVEEGREANPLLLRFLDAESIRDKRELLEAWEAYADENLLEGIAASLDIMLSAGSEKEKYRELLNCLKMMEHFETDRFR